MRNRATLVSLAAIALAFAGCGSSKKAETTAATTPGATGVTTNVEKPPPAPASSYNVHLAGFNGGSTTGTAEALININPAKGELCWQFSALTNVPSPTVARLFRTFPGATGEGGFLLGHKYTPAGCIKLETVVLELIVTKPEQFFVNIHTAQFPGGAVRGPLQV